MRISFLGTGTSNGVPVIGCQCEVCTSSDPHDHRLRSSVLLEFDESESSPAVPVVGGNYRLDEDSILAKAQSAPLRILIDCGPDFRQQMLRQPYGPIHALFVTHEHYDHVGGIDDFRPFCVFGSIPIYAEQMVVQHLAERLPYCFGPSRYPSAPKLELHTVSPDNPVFISGITVLPLRVMHGSLPILGFRIGSFAYITDMSSMPSHTLDQLHNLDTLVVNALRRHPHPTHQSIEEAVTLIDTLKPRRAYLTHLAHSAGLHADSPSLLPSNTAFAYDGLQLEVSL